MSKANTRGSTVKGRGSKLKAVTQNRKWPHRQHKKNPHSLTQVPWHRLTSKHHNRKMWACSKTHTHAHTHCIMKNGRQTNDKCVYRSKINAQTWPVQHTHKLTIECSVPCSVTLSHTQTTWQDHGPSCYRKPPGAGSNCISFLSASLCLSAAAYLFFALHQTTTNFFRLFSFSISLKPTVYVFCFYCFKFLKA